MHRHHHNLEKLYRKLQFRYGDDDDLVMQLKHEFESLDSLEAKAKNIAMKNHGRSGRDDRCLGLGQTGEGERSKEDGGDGKRPVHPG